ncbi:MAG: SsrA-binding protein SmpB [Acidimicrobiales bacterium]|nr:SsrA-binding protein SmpB [Acidimicrobiales bacterium]
MAAQKKKPQSNVVATNRQARRDYEILESWEAGIVLQGSEVKSLRESKVQLSDAYARVQGHELYLVGLHIASYSNASAQGGHELARTRKLLMHHHQIDEIKRRVEQDRLTLIPLKMYFTRGMAKVELGIGRGRKHYDKRQVIAERDAERDARRAMAAQRRNDD